MEAIALRLKAIATREAIALGVEAVALRLEAINVTNIRLEEATATLDKRERHLLCMPLGRPHLETNPSHTKRLTGGIKTTKHTGFKPW